MEVTIARDALASGQKALDINLSNQKYGTFRRNWGWTGSCTLVFRVGAAANTIAKSISAYDMTISDAIYGECNRYVSRDRLEKMLSYEYDLLVERLAGKRGDQTEFFAFADTVTTRNFKGTNECHGWMGPDVPDNRMANPTRFWFTFGCSIPTASRSRKRSVFSVSTCATPVSSTGATSISS